MKKFQKGFTMIELLIVIAVLGVLAVAVLSAINPIEQINRGRDTASRSDAEQLLGGIERYYASNPNGLYPWQNTTLSPQGTAWAAVNIAWAAPAGGTAPLEVLNRLSGTGTSELKASFVTRITGATYNTLYKYNNGLQGGSTYICFRPQSQSFKTEAITRCGAACGGLPADLASAGCATLCDATTPFVCLP